MANDEWSRIDEYRAALLATAARCLNGERPTPADLRVLRVSLGKLTALEAADDSAWTTARMNHVFDFARAVKRCLLAVADAQGFDADRLRAEAGRGESTLWDTLQLRAEAANQRQPGPPPEIPPPHEKPAAPPEDAPSQTLIDRFAGCSADELKIVMNGHLTADEKMRSLCGANRDFLGKSSVDWGCLLGVSDSAIRQTSFWQQDRKRALRND